MYTIKNIYFRDLVTDLYKKKFFVIAFVTVCTLAFAFLGYKSTDGQGTLSKEQQLEINTYNQKLQEYDDAIAVAAENLRISEEQLAPLQEYTDNSIYMKLDSQNIQAASVQYGIITEPETDVNNIYTALTYYINEGGLIGDLGEEYASLDAKYWREIIFCSLSGNVMNITIYHYDADQVREMINIVKQRLLAQVPSIVKVHGEFSLSEIDTANYVKTDLNVANTQNNNLNNLRSYISGNSDCNTRLLAQQNGKQSYIDTNTPEVMEPVTPNRTVIMVKYMIVGILFGIVIPCVCFILSYILGNRIRSKDGLKEYGLSIIGRYSPKGHHYPQLNRSVMDLELLSKQNSWNSVFLDVLNESEVSKKVASEYKDALTKTGIHAADGYHLEDSADELKHLVEIKNCILLIQIAKTTYPQLESQINLCQKFGITILGCIVIE